MPSARAWLKERGYQVTRFQAGEVESSPGAVQGAIRLECEARMTEGST